MTVNVLVLCGLGINCEEETEAAYKLVGAKVQLCHINDLVSGRVNIHSFQILHFPGGFSFGDHLGAGRALASRIRFKQVLGSGACVIDDLRLYEKRGGFILGICNGFQVLVCLGLLPGNTSEGPARLALAPNEDGKFQDRWVHCRPNPQSPLSHLWPKEIMSFPIRHGEGRLFVSDEAMKAELQSKGLIALSYVSSDGSPANPNGSYLSCAALTNASGRVLGMMPHPEAYLSFLNHPNWLQVGQREQAADGLEFFRNLVKHVSIES